MKQWLKKIIVALGLGIAVFIMLTMQPFVSASQTQSPKVIPDLLQKHVKYLSVDVYPRSFDFPEHLDLAADYIKSDLLAADVAVEEQNVRVEGKTYRNLIARFGPAQGKVMVIGAHYDSHGDARHGRQLSERGFTIDTHTPGADDNASGVAGVMELAKLLVKKPPPQPVELVFYTLEEPPNFRTDNMGSAWHARMLREHANVAKGEVFDMMVSVEMIGYFSDEPDSQDFPVSAMSAFYPTTGDFIAVVGRYADISATRRLKSALLGGGELPVRSITAPAFVMGVDFSDHLNYWAQDFSAVMVTDTSFYRNHQYHRSGDTYDQLNYQRMASVVQGLYRLTQER